MNRIASVDAIDGPLLLLLFLVGVVIVMGPILGAAVLTTNLSPIAAQRSVPVKEGVKQCSGGFN